MLTSCPLDHGLHAVAQHWKVSLLSFASIVFAAHSRHIYVCSLSCQLTWTSNFFLPSSCFKLSSWQLIWPCRPHPPPHQSCSFCFPFLAVGDILHPAAKLETFDSFPSNTLYFTFSWSLRPTYFSSPPLISKSCSPPWALQLPALYNHFSMGSSPGRTTLQGSQEGSF